jgi:thioredoxin reductase (NADPH)
VGRELPIAGGGDVLYRPPRALLLVVNWEPALARAIELELRRAFHDQGFDARCVDSERAALELLQGARGGGQRVALVVAEHELSGTSGIDLIAKARRIFPEIRTVLLVEHADMQAGVDAVNAGVLDHFLIKPLPPAGQQLIPVVSDLLDDWSRWAVEEERAVRIVGPGTSERVHELRDFLSRTQIHHRFLDVQRDDEAQRLLSEAPPGSVSLPLVVLEDGTRLEEPSRLELAEALGLSTRPLHADYDLVIVGGGPAGLAAAVYGASEGLRTALIERDAPGGQAGQSSKIENYLGFPSGLSGTDLAQRALRQSRRFEAEIVHLREAQSLAVDGTARIVHVSDGSELRSSAVLIACGASYRRLDVPGIDRLVGRGVFCGAAASEAQGCEDRHVLVIGGANAAGQAALHFSQHARQVTVLIRGDSLEKGMSRYLVDRINAASTIDVRTAVEVGSVEGDIRLEAVMLRDVRSGATETVSAHALFIFIGALPHTEWLQGSIARDASGFVLSGRELKADDVSPRWPLQRDPLPLESSTPGVFVAGDVRRGSTKRVASAVGEGAMAVQLIHEYLAE